MANHLPAPDSLQQTGNLELLARQVVEGFITGLHKSPFHGFSVEFAEHRLYNTGDSVKNVDWKLFARTDKLFVKRFEEETNLRCHLVIDASSSMYFPEKGFNKIAFSASAAACLIYLLRKQRDAFGLSCFAETLFLSTPAKSTTVHQNYLFAQLENLLSAAASKKTTAMASALHLLAEQVHKRSMIVIFSDLLENGADEASLNELFAALQHLKYNKHEVVIFNVFDGKQELAFDFANRPYHFVDMETGEEMKLHPSQVKDSYLQAMHDFRKKLQLRCAQYKIDLEDADIHEGYYQVLQAYLIKRARMG